MDFSLYLAHGWSTGTRCICMVTQVTTPDAVYMVLARGHNSATMREVTFVVMDMTYDGVAEAGQRLGGLWKAHSRAPGIVIPGDKE